MREDHKKMLSKLFECVTKHEKLHSHLTNMPILLEENWFNTTQKAIKRFMGKCSTMFIKFHEKKRPEHATTRTIALRKSPTSDLNE